VDTESDKRLGELTIVVNGKPVHITVIASYGEPLGQYSFPYRLYFSPRVAAKAYELALTARSRGKSLKNPGLEFLRRLLLVKQARNVLDVLENYGEENGRFVSVVEKRDNESLLRNIQENVGNVAGDSGEPLYNSDAVSYYKSRLCLSGESGENVENLSELEELVIAHQSLSIEDKWPRC